MFQNNLLVLTASLKVQFLRCASFRVYCGVQKYASFHEIRDALNLIFLLCRLNFEFLRNHQC